MNTENKFAVYTLDRNLQPFDARIFDDPKDLASWIEEDSDRIGAELLKNLEYTVKVELMTREEYDQYLEE